MFRKITVEQESRSEKGRVIAAGAAIGGLALTFGLTAANKMTQPDPLAHTHKETIHVVFGDQANTEEGMAQYLQKLTNTPDTASTLVARMNEMDPNHDHAVQSSQEMSVPVDVPDNHK